MDRLRRKKSTIFWLVFPGMFVFTFAVLYPIGKAFMYGLTDWKGVGELNYVGLENYKRVIFEDKVFRQSLWNALQLALATVIIQHPLAMFFAILVDKLKGKTEAFFRAVLFIPCVISIVVTSKMWVNLFHSTYGLVNKALTAAGLGFLKQDWLGDPKVAIYSVIFVIMWQGFGYAFLIYYSGIKGVPEELYEAAKVDGANSWQQFWRITLPLVKPVIFVNITIAITSSLKQMEPIFLMTGGGPGTTTQFVANYLYVQAFNAKNYGYANAISFVFVVICVLISILVQRIFREKE